MYNKTAIDSLISFISSQDGISDKNRLAELVKERFHLETDRRVYFCRDFAIRFSRSKSRNMGNTVLSLSALQKHDSKPFFVCIVTPAKNYLLLANTTFLSKISQTSQALRIDNIRDSFNGSDIMKSIEGMDNSPQNFEQLFAIHEGFTWSHNLIRLVETTNNISPTGKRFVPTEAEKELILSSPERAEAFIRSADYKDLFEDLSRRVNFVKQEITIAASIDNVNLRGRIIEYLIASGETRKKNEIINALRNNKSLPEFKTEDKLGDYAKNYASYNIQVDIKTKVLSLSGNPKAYNIDKLLQFLSAEKTVYLIFLVGIDKDGEVIAQLCPVFQKQLLDATNVIRHWAGRNSRGVAQFNGNSLSDIIWKPDNSIDIMQAKTFLQSLLSL